MANGAAKNWLSKSEKWLNNFEKGFRLHDSDILGALTPNSEGFDSFAPARFGLSACPSMSLAAPRLHSRAGAFGVDGHVGNTPLIRLRHLLAMITTNGIHIAHAKPDGVERGKEGKR